MSNYTLHPDDDKRTAAGAAITASSTKIDGGTGYHVGLAVSGAGVLTAKVDPGFVHNDGFASQVVQSKDVFGALHSATTTITSVADDGNGFCDFTLAAHGLSLGDVISVNGSTSGNVDGVQKVTDIPDANSFVTDKAFTASATAGVFSTVAGRFADMTAEKWIIRRVTDEVATVSNTTLRSGGSDFNIRRSIHKLEAMWTRRVATAIRAGNWNIFTGTFSTAPTVADDEPTFGSDDAANPTQAIPGELVYKEPQPNPVQDDYKARNIW